MNEQLPTTNIPDNPISPVGGEPKIETKASSLNSFQIKTLSALKGVRAKFLESRFYKNKKVFWPINIGFGLIFFTLIIGLLFGNKNRTTSSVKNTPTPTPQSQSEVVEENGSAISQIEQKLKDLKSKISNFDPKQSRLKPPTLNFDVKF